MASLSNTKIKDTYQSLVKFSDNGNITIGAKQLTDGFGNNSPLYVSTTQIGIGITPQSGYGLHVSSNVKIGGNLEVAGTTEVFGFLYTRNTLRVLNAAGTGWHNWAVRSNGKYDLNVNDITAIQIKIFIQTRTQDFMDG